MVNLNWYPEVRLSVPCKPSDHLVNVVPFLWYSEPATEENLWCCMQFISLSNLVLKTPLDSESDLPQLMIHMAAVRD